MANAADPILLHVNTFPTARSLPFYVGVDKGIFARHGLKVELEFTDSFWSASAPGSQTARSTSWIRPSTTPSPWSRWPRFDVVIVSGGDSGTTSSTSRTM